MGDELAAKFPKINPFLLKKWSRIFSAFFDRNAGGEVDWGDFYLITKKVREIYGAESEQMEMAKSSLKDLWNGLLDVADANKDKNISVTEWVAALEKQKGNTEAPWFKRYATFLFRLFDVSNDNEKWPFELDVAEYADGMAAYGFDASEAHEAFAKFAVNGKGQPVKAIDEPTFRKYWNDYFYSTDPKAPGNYLFGIPK